MDLKIKKPKSTNLELIFKHSNLKKYNYFKIQKSENLKYLSYGQFWIPWVLFKYSDISQITQVFGYSDTRIVFLNFSTRV